MNMLIERLTEKLHPTRYLLAVAALALSTSVHAAHIVDGVFGAGEWTVSATDGAPARATVARSAFTVAGVPNGGILYVEQSSGLLGDKLELAYECTICHAPLPADVGLNIFFQTGGDDYGVRIFLSGGTPTFLAFEKAPGTFTPLNPDGSLNFSSGWTPLDAADLALARFDVGLGSGPSPNSASDHLIGEFEVSINKPGVPGLYPPPPSIPPLFWSASTTGTGIPVKPISSGFFRLTINGNTIVNQILDSNGEPVLLPISIPAPETLTLMLAGVGAMGFIARRRRMPLRRS